MMIRRKVLGRTGDGAVRALLLKAASHDYFGELAELGEDRCRAYWLAHHRSLLTEFEGRYPEVNYRAQGFPEDPGPWPLGLHLFGWPETPEPPAPDPRLLLHDL